MRQGKDIVRATGEDERRLSLVKLGYGFAVGCEAGLRPAGGPEYTMGLSPIFI